MILSLIFALLFSSCTKVSNKTETTPISINGIVVRITDDDMTVIPNYNVNTLKPEEVITVVFSENCITMKDEKQLSLGELEVGNRVEITYIEKIVNDTRSAECTLVLVNTANSYVKISPIIAKQIMEVSESFLLVDVRTKSEHELERIEGAILVPVTDMERIVEDKIPNKETLIMVYCRSGVRSNNAAEILARLQYHNVYDIGGILDWPFETIGES